MYYTQWSVMMMMMTHKTDRDKRKLVTPQRQTRNADLTAIKQAVKCLTRMTMKTSGDG